MITSTIHVLILVPVFFALMKERALRRGTLVPAGREYGKALTTWRLNIFAVPPSLSMKKLNHKEKWK
jgi:hypothetical protein